MLYGMLADAIVAIHLAYVGFVVVGLLLVVTGWLCGWSWVRNRWFRIVHLLAIAIVVAEAACDVECPLTTWERELRLLAGQPVDDATFVGRIFHELLYYEGPQWVFTLCYFGFALLILATFVLVPPRWRAQGSPPAEPGDRPNHFAPQAR